VTSRKSSDEWQVTSEEPNSISGEEMKAAPDHPPARTAPRTAGKVGGYKDLLVWRKGIDLVKEIYQLTKPFPADERFGLVSQMRRAAVSIPSNIAEGQARKTTREFVQFVSHAEGSLAELDTQLILAVELGYSSATRVACATELVSGLKRMLNALRRALLKTLTSDK
jgi:four helix bundle protein